MCFPQVPKDHVDEFKSITKFKVFNTNNLWASLEGIDRLVSYTETAMELDVIVNRKVREGGRREGREGGSETRGREGGRGGRGGREGGRKEGREEGRKGRVRARGRTVTS